MRLHKLQGGGVSVENEWKLPNIDELLIKGLLQVHFNLLTEMMTTSHKGELLIKDLLQVHFSLLTEIMTTIQ